MRPVPVTLAIPPPFRGPTAGKGEVQVEGDSVRACLEAAEAAYPGLLDLVYDKGGVRRSVRLFVGDDPLGAGELDDPIPDGVVLSIVAAIGGG